jgi:TRAP-type C4-dicarboxylate transport system substrate-binding protein
VNTLVANTARLNELSPENQEILRTAASATRDWVLGHRVTESAHAAAYCNRGGKVVNATAAELRALNQAVQPLYAELEQDPATKAMIDRIRTLKQSVQVPPTGVAAPC